MLRLEREREENECRLMAIEEVKIIFLRITVLFEVAGLSEIFILFYFSYLISFATSTLLLTAFPILFYNPILFHFVFFRFVVLFLP